MSQTIGDQGPEDAEDRLYEIKQKAVNQAREDLEKQGFDAIVLMTCYVNEVGHTVTMQANSGNYHAQNGMIQTLTNRRRRDDELDSDERRSQ